MIRRTLVMVTASALLAMPLAVGMAQPVSTYPGLSVAFRDPFATGSATDPFGIWMRITNTADTDFDFSVIAPPGAYLSTFFDCGTVPGAFTDCAGAGEYNFVFNADPATSLYGLTNLHVGAGGGTFEYLLGTLNPIGTAALGTYRFLNSGFSFGVEGETLAGDLASACVGGGDECNFRRTIVGVDVNIITPEPSTLLLLGGGFAALLVARRRRRNI